MILNPRFSELHLLNAGVSGLNHHALSIRRRGRVQGLVHVRQLLYQSLCIPRPQWHHRSGLFPCSENPATAPYSRHSLVGWEWDRDRQIWFGVDAGFGARRLHWGGASPAALKIQVASGGAAHRCAREEAPHPARAPAAASDPRATRGHRAGRADPAGSAERSEGQSSRLSRFPLRCQACGEQSLGRPFWVSRGRPGAG